jgi:hypothetical protein
MLAHGFKIELLIDLARAGLATRLCRSDRRREYDNHHMSDQW